jgi:hypothetical protein
MKNSRKNAYYAPMKAFVCVYRHPSISERDLGIVRRNAENIPELRSFLDNYFQHQSFYDWGDDPSFFQASQRLGDPRRASWGVCRPKVRRQLGAGDVVIFICSCEGLEAGSWDYYYVGFGTVRISLQREQIFQDDQYAEYRSFFNMISRWENGHKVQYEVFEGDHNNFEGRCQAGYILFQLDKTDFNLVNPLPIARYDGRQTAENWHTTDPLVAKLYSALFLDGEVKRYLHTSRIGFSHADFPLHRHFEKAGRQKELADLWPKLAEISTSVRDRT